MTHDMLAELVESYLGLESFEVTECQRLRTFAPEYI
jgi:hypothetical protein